MFVFWEAEWWIASAVCHVSPWGKSRGVRECGRLINTSASRWAWRTCGKPLLGERKSVSAALKFHVNSWQGGSLIQKLHCQSGGVRGAVWELKLGPQCPGTWGQTQFRTSCCYYNDRGGKTLTYLHFQTFPRCRSTSTNIYSALHSYNQRGGKNSTVHLCSSAAEGLRGLHLCILPNGGRQRLHAADASVHRHQDLHVGEHPGVCHGFWVVAVVYPQVRRARRALPVHGQVEWRGVDPVRLHLNGGSHSTWWWDWIWEVKLKIKKEKLQ